MSLLNDKIVFITGASAGIGKACAEQFAAEGAKLILTARRTNRLKELSSSLKEKFNSSIITYQLDVRDKQMVGKVIDQIPSEWKPIEILINNAGLARGIEKIHEGLTDNWDEMIDTNVKGLLYVTREILPSMVERESGHIINIGSVAGHEVYPNGNVYCASKFAVDAITQGIRMDILGKNIKVSTVDPGLVETEFSEVRFKGDTERAKNVYTGITPLTAADVASAVLFCATRPQHVNINQVVIMPTIQASTTQVYRK